MVEVEVVHGVAGYCGACGTLILAWRPRLVIGSRNYCAPLGSACHKAGLIAGGWKFTPADAADLLAADIEELRRVGSRAVDPHHDPALLQRPQHVAA